MTRSSTVSGQEWLTILHSKMPSFTASYRLSPVSARGRMCVRWVSEARLVLIQSEKASCSSTRTEWVVPADNNYWTTVSTLQSTLGGDFAIFAVFCGKT